MTLFRSGTGTSAAAAGALLMPGRREPEPAAALAPDCGQPQLAALRASAAAGSLPAPRTQLPAVPEGADRTRLLAHTANIPASSSGSPR